MIVVGFCVLVVLEIKGTLAVEKNGYFVSPPFLDVDVGDSQPQKEFYMEVGNHSGVAETFDVSVVDFGSLDESGGIAFLSKEKYALAPWISLDKREISVEPGESQKVKVTIINKEDLSPGGHYGAVLATLQNKENTGMEKVGVKQSMAMLIYLQKTGGVKKNLYIKDIDYKNNWWKAVDQVKMRFENSGNVHLVPRGKIEILDRWGNIVGKGIINEASGKILPENFRVMPVTIRYFNSWKWPGKYVVDISYRYDGKDSFDVVDKSFIYIGKEGLVICILLVICLSFFGIKLWPYFRK